MNIQIILDIKFFLIGPWKHEKLLVNIIIKINTGAKEIIPVQHFYNKTEMYKMFVIKQVFYVETKYIRRIIKGRKIKIWKGFF